MAQVEQQPRSSRFPVWALVVIGVVVIVAAGVIGGVIANAMQNTSSASGSSGSCPVTPVANENLPSVVTISASGRAGSGVGSGEVIRSDGYILTNNHVVAPAANGGTLQVRFNNGVVVGANIVGRDPLTDLAVVKVSGQSDLRPIPIGSSSDLTIGQPVIALGSPLGLVGTVTNGIVSALDRTIEVPGEGNRSALLIDAIQTDAAINPGNSGGSLVDCAGKLVGIPSAGATVPSASGSESSGGSIGLGFAIPVNLAMTVSNEIISTGHVTHSYLGLSVVPVTAESNPRGGGSSGLLIDSVAPRGPAADAGLRTGDVITSIDGDAATSADQLAAITLTKKPGETVKIGYSRNGNEKTTTVTLGSLPGS